MNQQPTTTWRNPRWASLSGPLSPLRAIFENLSEYLARPTFYNGIQIGNGGTPTPGPDGKPIMPPVVDLTPDYLDSLTVYDPAAPTGAVGQGGIHTVILEWQGALGGTYQVQLSTNNTFTAIIQDVTVTGLVTSITGLNPATTYYARVRAVNPKDSGDVGAWSATMTASTGTVGTADIAANAVTAAKIAAGQITADHLTAAGITADKIVGGTIDASDIVGVNISGVNITGSSITGTTITGGTFQSASSGHRVMVTNDGSGAVYFYGSFFPTPHWVADTAGNLEVHSASFLRFSTNGSGILFDTPVSSDITVNGTVWGNAGGSGGAIRVREGNNSLSFSWDGTSLRFYIGGVNVKTI